MSDNVLVQHPPAVKVGGRRLSLSTKHKPHISSDTSQTAESDIKVDDAPDYPRPAAPGEEEVHHRHEEDVPPKKERKHSPDNDKKMREYSHWKAETTRPTRDTQGAYKAFNAARIAQPAGKSFGV